MKRALGLVLFLALVAGFTANGTAQDASNVSESLDTLRSQLLDAQAKEAELQTRQQQLDEDLKPENIERSLAGIGSTKPEELRESRRRQLTIERDGVRAQLKLVTTSRERLESVIRTAEAQAYQQSMLNQTVAGKHSWSLGWVVGITAAVGEILGIVMLVILAMRRARRT
jgi:flagellar biosynthesis GTPase FlhF